MKKSTVLILFIVFAASVLVVGLFGTASEPLFNTVYVQNIIPTGIVVTSSGENLINRLQVDQDGVYWIEIPYEEGISVMMSYIIDPADSTDQSIDVAIVYPEPSDDPVAVIGSRGEIQFRRQGTVRIRYKAKDDGSTRAEVDLYIYCYAQ